MQTTIPSDQARINWHNIVDAAAKGDEIVIERYNKPVAVLVNYDDWQAAARWRRLAKADRALAAVDAGDVVTESEFVSRFPHAG